MTFRVFAVVVLFASLLMAQNDNASQSAAQTNGPVFSFHSRGTLADFFSFQNGTDISLSVNRNGEGGQQAATFLNFSTFTFNQNGFTDIFGFGQVPNEALHGGGDKHVSLSVDTSQVNSFQTITCTFDFINFISSCQPGPFGLVQIDWEQDGNSTLHQVSETRQTFFQFTIHSQVNSESASAPANGSVLGIPVSNGFGNVGVHHNSTVEIFKN